MVNSERSQSAEAAHHGDGLLRGVEAIGDLLALLDLRGPLETLQDVVAMIEHHLVFGRVEDVMKSQRELHDSKIWAEVAAVLARIEK